MDVLERDRIAAAMIALRPDWASNGVDRLKSLRVWLTANLMDWSYRDALVGLVLVASDTASNGPARLLTDGPWRTTLRYLTGETTTATPPHADSVPRCDICHELRPYHDADHPFTTPNYTGSRPEVIAAARKAAGLPEVTR